MAELGVLLAELLSGDPDRAEAAATALAAQSDAALPQLTKIITQADADARWWAVRTLAGFPQDRAGELISASLADPDNAVRQCACLALCRRPHSVAIPALLGLLDDQDRLLARLASDALVAAGSLSVSGLLESVEGGSTQARAEAARALGLIGDTRAVPSLFKLLDSESAMLEHWASEGLAKMGVGMHFFETSG